MKRDAMKIPVIARNFTHRLAGQNAKAQPACFLGATGWAVVGNPSEGALAGARSGLINRERLRALGSDPPALRHMSYGFFALLGPSGPSIIHYNSPAGGNDGIAICLREQHRLCCYLHTTR